MSDVTSLKTISELTNEEKMDLVSGSDNRVVQLLFRVMGNEIIACRDAAVAIDPAKKTERDALMDQAHAMQALYHSLKSMIEVSLLDLHNEIKKQVVEQDLADEAKMLDIMTNPINLTR
jgi:hypothetical protein